MDALPGGLGDEPGRSGHDQGEDRLPGTGGGQADAQLGLHLHDASGDRQQSQARCVELGRSRGGAAGHKGAQVPLQPVGSGTRNQAHLIGGRAGAVGSIGGGVKLPGLDMVFRPGGGRPVRIGA